MLDVRGLPWTGANKPLGVRLMKVKETVSFESVRSANAEYAEGRREDSAPHPSKSVCFPVSCLSSVDLSFS